ncbi:MAG TPA: polyribonucleotide nucleotidyltransferase, partial [Planctomycetota bacterium]|nr:polyribonucleotide nucleotidyltransferase [Planctomycetota bacterium]
PGGFFKREGRSTTKEILTSRLIDRPHRPLFKDTTRKEVTVTCQVMSADLENDGDIPAMVGASAALSLCEGLEFFGPTGSVRIGRIGDTLIVNPTQKELETSTLDLVVSGTEDAILMVEAGAKEVGEQVLLDALALAHKTIKEIVALVKELVEKAGRKLTPHPAGEIHAIERTPLLDELQTKYWSEIHAANLVPGKFARKDALHALHEKVKADYAAKVEAKELDGDKLDGAFADLERLAIRLTTVKEKKRADGRAFDEIRPIDIEVGYLPRTHGSALFTRGETQAIVTATLGTGMDTQRIDGLNEAYEKTFMLHYNFPAYCVGETWPDRGPKRREIGHGALAERALEPVVPEAEKWPYTIRIVSEITESNGSSSMASVCGGTLALMDAAVPIKRPVAGIAMGLIKEGEDYAILSDIQGAEDHEGDMDFKVAGTQLGITALQMDIKVKGISLEIMQKALEQAKAGRLAILRKMLSAIDRPRKEISRYAPQLVQVKISTEKIGALIGPGGKVIRKIQEDTKTQIEIDDQAGTATIAGGPGSNMEEAIRIVRSLTEEVEIGKVYRGRVTSVKDFGAFVEILPGQEGLCHVSELSEEYVKNVGEVVKIGDVIDVKVLDIDNQDRIRLSRKAVMRDARGGGGPAKPPTEGPPPART